MTTGGIEKDKFVIFAGGKCDDNTLVDTIDIFTLTDDKKWETVT